MRRFEWTEQRIQALALARSGMTQAAIAQALSVTRRAIEGWARRPAWKARWQEMVQASFAEWEEKMRADTQRRRAELAAREASYTPKPRGTRSHRTRWYQHARAQMAETLPTAPMRSRPPQRSAEERIREMQQQRQMPVTAPHAELRNTNYRAYLRQKRGY